MSPFTIEPMRHRPGWAADGTDWRVMLWPPDTRPNQMRDQWWLSVDVYELPEDFTSHDELAADDLVYLVCEMVKTDTLEEALEALDLLPGQDGPKVRAAINKVISTGQVAVA